MKKSVCFLAFCVLGLLLFLQGCDFEATYDIKVINDTDASFSVYMDDEFQFKLAASGSSTIRNLGSGTYFLDVRAGDTIIAERIIELDSDTEWTVYTEKYEITVWNDSGSDFSFYLDGVYQFEVEAGEGMTVTGISADIHSFEARIGDFVVADESVDVDQDMEWTVY